MTSRALLALACFPLGISFSPGDLARLDTGEAVVVVLPADDSTVALRAATAVAADGHRLVAWTRRIERLQTAPYVSSVGRFSDPPVIEDLDGLSLDDEDVQDLRRCRPGRCGLKLSDEEIAHVRQTIADAGGNWKPAAQAVFREVVLDRVRRYALQGHTAPTASYHDRKSLVLLDSEFAALAAEVAIMYPQFFPLTNYLALYPKGDIPQVESWFYWSKDSLGAKPIVSVTHVAIVQSVDPHAPEAMVARKQVYASHYITASLSLTAVGLPSDGSQRHLVYLNHTRADVFDGMFGGVIRSIIERRLRGEGPKALETLRGRLESGEP